MSEDETCRSNIDNKMSSSTKQRKLPEFIAIFEEDLYKTNNTELRELLKTIGMKELKKIRHTIKGIGIGMIKPGLAPLENDGDDGTFAIGIGGIVLKFEHMVLFSSYDPSLL